MQAGTRLTSGDGEGAADSPIVLPYSYIVGQENLRRALEIAYVSPAVSGVLATGQRGTAKSTTVRAFARMVSGALPVTLPIGATEDRVIGGWRIEDLMASTAIWQPGLIEEAGDGAEPGMLYIDEVNLLDDHLVNIILDVASTGILTVQRDGARKSKAVRFNLVGTMNPEEGSLRPQLLDRFGLVVLIESVTLLEDRRQILETVLRFEAESGRPSSKYLADGYRADAAKRSDLAAARDQLNDVQVPNRIIQLAAAIAMEFRLEGHRGELVLLRAARALAAIDDEPEVTSAHLMTVAPLALIHRRASTESGTLLPWSDADDDLLDLCVASSVAP